MSCRKSHVTLALRPALSSDLVLYLAAHAGGRHVTAAAPSFSYTFPSVGRLLPPLPPPALFGCMAFLCLVKPTAWSDGAVPPPLPVSPGRCMTFKQGEKLTLSSHLQVCGANLEPPPPNSWRERLSEVGQNPVCRWWNLNFSPSFCPHRPVHDGSAHWHPHPTPVLLLHVSECCEIIRAGPGSPIQNTFKAAHCYSAPRLLGADCQFSRRPLPPEPFSQFLWGSASSAFSSWRFTTLRTRRSSRTVRKSPFRGHDGSFCLLLRAAGPPGVPHPFLLLRDVLLRGRVAHPLPEPTAAGLPRLEVRNPPVASPAAALASLTRTSVAGTPAGPWWAAPDCTTPRPSWTPTSWPSVRKKAGASWPSTCSPSSTISTGRKPRWRGFFMTSWRVWRTFPLLLLQDDLRSGELLKWTPRVNRTCMYSRRPETLLLVLQHWTCWRWMISTPHSQHRLSVQTHLAILNQPLLQRSCHNTRDTFYGKHLNAQTDILFSFFFFFLNWCALFFWRFWSK